MIPHADAAVRAAVALELCHGFPRSPGGSAIRASSGAASDRGRSPRPRVLATLWVWTCAPGGIAAVATPIGLPYLTTFSPAGIRRIETLWPRGIVSRTVKDAGV